MRPVVVRAGVVIDRMWRRRHKTDACGHASKLGPSPDGMPAHELDTAVFVEARERLARRMKELRNVAGMPQAVAAARAGIDRSTWIRIERAKVTDVKLETLLRIEYALGAGTLEALFCETTGDLVGRTNAGGS